MEDTEAQAVADQITAQQLNILRVEIDRAFRADDKLHPKKLYPVVKDTFKTDYATFLKQLCACVKVGKVIGYKTGRGGTIYRDELQEQLQEKREAAHRQAPKKAFDPFARKPFEKVSKEDLEYLSGEPVPIQPTIPIKIEASVDTSKLAITKPPAQPAQPAQPKPERIPLRAAGKLYNVPMTRNDIKTLLVHVLNAKEIEQPELSRCVEYDGKKYDCDAELFGRFVFFFFGGSLRVEGKKEGDQK
jgi:hypothetical protein